MKNLCSLKRKTCISPDIIARHPGGKNIHLNELYRQKIKRSSNHSQNSRSMSTATSSFAMHRRNLSPIIKTHKRNLNIYNDEIKSSHTPLEEFKISQIIPNVKERDCKKPRRYFLSHTRKAKNTSQRKMNEDIKILIEKKHTTDSGDLSRIIQPSEIKVCVTPISSQSKNCAFADTAERCTYSKNLNIQNVTQNSFYKKQNNLDLNQVINLTTDLDASNKKVESIK
ncbi:unnamed protein product [Moneuplotes crassus]|uniref:Uncharacterized protein n=1 Tax=Euplotes crassus TaxID=5936 RepID=A0AAD1XFE6_EUPCR|nr:unnamed protein product [Moneuplotes crassus]